MSHSFHSPNAVNNDNSVGFFRTKISLEINLSSTNSGLLPVKVKLRSTKHAKWVGTEFYEDQLTGPKDTLPLLDGFIRQGTIVTKNGKRVPNRIAAIVTLDIDNDDHKLLADRVEIVNEMYGIKLILSTSASGRYKVSAIVSAFDKDGKRIFLSTKLCAKAMATLLGISWESVDEQGIERCFLTKSLFEGLANGIHTPVDQSSLLALASALRMPTPIQNDVELERETELTKEEHAEQQALMQGVPVSTHMSLAGELNGVKVYFAHVPGRLAPIGVDEDGRFVTDDPHFLAHGLASGFRAAIENGSAFSRDSVPFHEYTEITRENMLRIKESIKGKIPMIGKSLDMLCLFVLFNKEGRAWLSYELGAAVLEVSVERFYQIRKSVISSGYLTKVQDHVTNVSCARFEIDEFVLNLAKSAAIEVQADGILARYVGRNSETLVSGSFNTHEYNMCVIAVTHDLPLEAVVAELSEIPDWFCERRLKRLASSYKWAQRKFL